MSYVNKVKKSGVEYDITDARLSDPQTSGKVLKSVQDNDEVVMDWSDETAELPELPEGASEKTYILKAVNGVLTWVEEV